MQNRTGENGHWENNLNLLRVIAALGVLASHAYPLSLGATAEQPLVSSLGVTLGSLSVQVFFAISGFLVTQSFCSRNDWRGWAVARALRILPGLFVCVVLTALILGPAVTTEPLATYFSARETTTYVIRNLSLFALQYDLPGVFQSNPYGGAINGSLWTLFHEVLCYGGVLLAGTLGVLACRRRMAAALALYLAAYTAGQLWPEPLALPTKVTSLLDLSLPFAIGTAFYVWQRWLPLSWTAGVGLALVAVLARPFPVFHEIFVLTLCYWVFLVAYLPGGFIRRYNAVGDYSYGIYIYAFPMQQLAAHLFGPMTPYQNMALAAPATLALAMLSWHLVEKPALASKARVGAALARGSRRLRLSSGD